MDKLLVYVVMLFATNLAVAFPIKAKKMSGQLEADFEVIDNITNIPMRANSIHGQCEEIETCELLYGVFRVCKKVLKCTQ